MITTSTNSNPWLAVSTGLAGIIVGYVFGTSGMSLPGTGGGPVAVTPPPAPPTAVGTPATMDDDAVLGDEDATITLIEFTDYQCSFCARHYTQTLKQIITNYVDTGKVKLVVRDFPLSFHAQAQKAAEASECAADQGKFWEMHSKLFTTVSEWGNANVSTALKALAADLDLDEGEFAECLDGGIHTAEVQKDMADGSKSGIDGTPGFWIIGPDGQTKQISGAYPYATFQAAFDEML